VGDGPPIVTARFAFLRASPVQLQDPAFVDAAAALIQQTGIDAALLEFELTESKRPHWRRAWRRQRSTSCCLGWAASSSKGLCLGADASGGAAGMDGLAQLNEMAAKR